MKTVLSGNSTTENIGIGQAAVFVTDATGSAIIERRYGSVVVEKFAMSASQTVTLAGYNKEYDVTVTALTGTISIDVNDSDLQLCNYASLSQVNAATSGVCQLRVGGVLYDCDGTTFKKIIQKISVLDFGAKCDGIAVYQASATNSTTSTISDVTANFAQTDVGKKCVIVPYVDTLAQLVKYGTITSVASPTLCTVSLNGAPGTLTGATFIYGTDDRSAVQAAIDYVSSNNLGEVSVPAGICCISGNIVIKAGVTLRGAANFSTGGKAKDFRYKGTSLVLTSYLPSTEFLTVGDGANSPAGVAITALNADCLNLAPFTYKGGGRTDYADFCTFLHGITNTLSSGPTSRISKCNIFGHNDTCNVVQLSGDSTFSNNLVIGAGNGFYGIKLSNPDDICIAENHIWKDSGLSSMLGGSIFVSFNTASTLTGGVTIIGNKFDTAYGPHVYIKASGNSVGRGINIIGNQSMNNDAVTNGTGPFISLEIQSGSTLRGLNVHGNIVRGSWNDPTKGQHTCFIDGSLTAGTVIASSITGNIIDNVTVGGLVSFTPGYTAGNFSIAGSGTTAVAF